MQKMTDDQLIAQQQREIEHMKQVILDYETRMNRIRLRIICIGGPLNDNVDGYTKAQLVRFVRILEDTEP